MGSYKRVFDPLDLEVIDLVYKAALVQLAARDPLSDPIKELERQEALKKLVFAVAQPGSVEFDHLLDKVLEYASELFVSPAKPSPASEVEGEEVKRPVWRVVSDSHGPLDACRVSHQGDPFRRAEDRSEVAGLG
jgi:hypothetical protein